MTVYVVETSGYNERELVGVYQDRNVAQLALDAVDSEGQIHEFELDAFKDKLLEGLKCFHVLETEVETFVHQSNFRDFDGFTRDGGYIWATDEKDALNRAKCLYRAFRERPMTLYFHGDKKKPHKVTEEEFYNLKRSGFFWEIFPGAPEFFKEDEI